MPRTMAWGTLRATSYAKAKSLKRRRPPELPKSDRGDFEIERVRNGVHINLQSGKTLKMKAALFCGKQQME
jgi:hypothetical protein